MQKDGKLKAKNLFLDTSSDNESTFYKNTVTKLAVMSLFDKNTQAEFVDTALQDLQLHKNFIQNTIDDTYKGLDVYQKNVYAKLLEQLNGLEELLNRYKKGSRN